MPRLLRALAPALFAGLLLAGCAPAAETTPPPATTADGGASSEPDAEVPAAPDTAAYSAGPECDAYVDAKDASIAEANQTAAQVSLAELPFAVYTPENVLCVVAFYTRDEPENRPLGFEMAVNAMNGVGFSVFAQSPDLTTIDCSSGSLAMGCFTDSFGNIVIVGAEGQEALAPYFPSHPSFIGVGIHTVAAYRNS